IRRCCPNALNVNGHCCDGTQTVCGPAPGAPAYEQYCCAAGSVCCEGKTCCPVDGGVCCHGSGQCLPANLGPWKACGNVCCNSDPYTGWGDSSCCQIGAVCSGNPPRCCPQGQHGCGVLCCLDYRLRAERAGVWRRSSRCRAGSLPLATLGVEILMPHK